MRKNVMPFFDLPEREYILGIYRSLTSATSKIFISNAVTIRFSYLVGEDRFYECSLPINILKNQKEFFDILSEKISHKLSHLKINFFDAFDSKLGHFDVAKNSLFLTENSVQFNSTI